MIYYHFVLKIWCKYVSCIIMHQFISKLIFNMTDTLKLDPTLLYILLTLSYLAQNSDDIGRQIEKEIKMNDNGNGTM